MAERCILAGLQRAGVVRGDVEEMLTKRVAALFMPHGGGPRLYPSSSGTLEQLRQGSTGLLAAPDRQRCMANLPRPHDGHFPSYKGARHMGNATPPALFAV